MRKKARGFSLIEILVAVVLLAMIGAALMSSFSSAVDVKGRVDTISNRFHLARQAMERMANELSMAYVSAQKNLQIPVSETKFKGDKDKVSFDAFGHTPHIKNAKESDQREISYYLEQADRTGKPALMRKVRNHISLNLGEEGTANVLCPDVKSLAFKYWDEQNQLWNDTWETGASALKQTLPTRIQIEMVVAIDEQNEQKFLTETEIWLTKPLNFK